MGAGPTAILESLTFKLIAGAVGLGLLYMLWFELRKVPAKLAVLMGAAFIDMLGNLIVFPLLPFYAKRLGGSGITLAIPFWHPHIGIGQISALLVTSFTIAQLVSAPVWGRFSDRFGRRPALLVALGASAMAYIIFGFATSLTLLFLSRIVQGAGGGTVGVIQAYVADATEPENRARSLGWLSASTNLGVALGPVLGSVAIVLGERPVTVGGVSFAVGPAAPGLLAALLCLINMAFAWHFLTEAREVPHPQAAKPRTSRAAVMRVITHTGEPPSRLIWIYAIAMGAFQGTTTVLALFLNDRFGVTEKTIGYFFLYIGIISVVTRLLLLGRFVDWLGEAKLSRVGSTLLAIGLAGIPFARSIPVLAVFVALIPLGTAFTFPCVTALLSRVIGSHERGLYMGVQQTFGGAARAIFPLVTGTVFDTMGKSVPFFISGALVALTIVLGLDLEQRTSAHVARSTEAAG